MDADSRTKIIIGALVMVVWFGLVLAGKTDAAQFVDALKQILMALGVYHVVTKGNT